MPTLEDVRQATALIHGQIHRTPMIESSALDGIFGSPLTLKAELFQKTGSFKVRACCTRSCCSRRRNANSASSRCPPGTLPEHSPGRRKRPAYRRLS